MADDRHDLSHIDGEGNAHMVDVGEKPVTRRRAIARAFVSMTPETLDRIVAGDLPKGDVLGTARVAGVMAAKRTPELIPLCHPLDITHVRVEVEPAPAESSPGVSILATCETMGRTGVEMEALTAASVAALTVYDMCKAVEKGVRFEVSLESKDGGASGTWRREEHA
jgi:cyclic pyranopterin phosphate synthase